MAILDLDAMARYGAYAFFLDIAQRSPFAEGGKFAKSKQPYTSTEYFGGTAAFRAPIQPADATKALRLLAFSNAVDKGENTELRFFSPADNSVLIPGEPKFPLIFETKPGKSLVSVTPDLNEDFTVQTNADDGALFFKNVVSRGASTFIFQPGAKIEFNYTTSTGVDVSYSVTEGLSKTTTEGGGSTTTAGVQISGTFLGIGAEAELQQSWSKEWSSSQTIDFSTTNSKTISKTTQVSTTVDLGSTQADSEGKYFYGGLELIPGKKYQISVTEEVETLKAPLNGTFIVTPTGSENTTIKSRYSIPKTVFKDTFINEVRGNAVQGISEALFRYNYDALVQENLADRDWKFEDNPSRLFLGVTNGATFSGSTNLSIEVKPVVSLAPTPNSTDGALVAVKAAPVRTVRIPQKGSEQEIRRRTTREFFLDDYIPNNSNPGVAVDLAVLDGLSGGKYIINGTTQGGDIIRTGNNRVVLKGYKNSIIEAIGGYNTFDDSNNNGFNEYFLKGGRNMLFLESESNYVDSQGGLSLIDVDADTRLDVDSRAGTDILKISNTGADIAVTNWDFASDSLIFDGSINLKDVEISYDLSTGDYRVEIRDQLVAVLDAKDESLPAYDAVTGQYQGTRVQPFAFTSPDFDTFLSTLYSRALDRLPQLNELRKYKSSVDSGSSRESVVQSVLTSREYIASYVSDQEYVTALYQNILGRTPSENQIKKWVGKIDEGMEKGLIVESLISKDKFSDFFGEGSILNLQSSEFL
jgi:hypothetical protein